MVIAVSVGHTSYMHRFLVLICLISTIACHQPDTDTSKADEVKTNPIKHAPVTTTSNNNTKGGLLATRFKSLDELKSVVEIDYFSTHFDSSDHLFNIKPYVRLKHKVDGMEVSSILMKGVSEKDFIKAGIGGFWIRLQLAMDSPYFVFNRNSLLKVYNLSRRRGTVFGEGDMAFYDLAETMLYNISDQDLELMSVEDLSEKGYLNTFNHITSQVFMTAIFSERVADYIADTHERRNMPELISGRFTTDQLSDLSKGPVDNYVDIINNEWGQKLGNELQRKYNIKQNTTWTPELLVNFLNDIQSYYSWGFQISFKPYRDTDKVVVNFAKKLNVVLDEAPGLR